MLEPASNSKGARGKTATPWTLPEWEEYSESTSSSFGGNWSDVEADISLDTASSVASTEHQRVYRIQRTREGLSDEKQGNLKEPHFGYTRNRQEEISQDVCSVRSSVNWFQPARCVSPRVQEQKPSCSLSRQQDEQAKSELLAQQSEISAELQAVRRQLSEFQDKWKKSVQNKAGVVEAENSDASSWPSPIPKGCKSAEESVAVQTEDNEESDAVKQWLLLLTQKLKRLARIYSNEQNQHFQVTMTHLTDLWSSNNDNSNSIQEPLSSNNDDASSLSLWHVGHVPKNAVSLEVAERFLELEHAITSMNESVEQHGRRQMANFDRAVQQLQGYHHERMQRVVDESLAEIKLVRGRHKKKEDQLEDELRTAIKEIEKWKHCNVETEHRKNLDREAMQFQLSAAKEQHDHACRRYEDDIAQLKDQLESVRTERRYIANQHKDTHEAIAQAKEGALVLERQCQELKKQQQHTKELHEQEVCVLQDTVRQLREEIDERTAQHAQEQQSLVEGIRILKLEKKELEEKVTRDTEQHTMQESLLEKIEKRHEEDIRTMEAKHKQELMQLSENREMYRTASSTCAMETQTGLLAAEENLTWKPIHVGGDIAQAQIKELTRRCQALEKLLSKKFEDTPMSLSSSRPYESCLSDGGKSTSSVLGGHQGLNASQNSSIHSADSSRLHVSGKSRALARALLGSSNGSLTNLPLDNKNQLETTLATDEATLGAHEMWDSASFTSIDTADDLSSFASQRTTPRRRMRSTQEILTLARQIKHAAATASPLDESRERFEPDPEASWETHKHPLLMSRYPPSGKVATKPASRNNAKGAPLASAFDDLLC